MTPENLTLDPHFWPRGWPMAAKPLPVRWRLAAALLAATLVTTTVVGARLQYNFARHAPAYVTNADLFPFAWAWRHPGVLGSGLAFSLAVMAILLAHELGHYLACRYYRIDATLPYFLPAPTLIGTMGAFIRIRSPFRNRRELFDIGVAGPLAGMAVALPVLIAGLLQSRPTSNAVLVPVQVQFLWPPLGRLLIVLTHGHMATPLDLSPLARAGWVGLILTTLNLLPAAQLDGGHILYATLPRLHRAVSLGLMLALIAAGWRYWAGWYVWAALIAAMRARHPPVHGEPLGRGRVAIAILAAVLLVSTFALTPVQS